MIAHENRFGVATKVNDDAFASHLLNRAGYQFAHTVFVFVQHDFALGVADFLHDNLLRRLRRDTAEGHVIYLLFYCAADL